MSEPTDKPANETGAFQPAAEMTESMREVMSLDGDVARLSAYYAKWASYISASALREVTPEVTAAPSSAAAS